MKARETASRWLPGLGCFAFRQAPSRPHEVTGVSIRIFDQVVLVLGLGLPERTYRFYLGQDPSRPQPGRIDIGDGVERHASLLVGRVEDRRAIARADVVPLAVFRRRIVNLEE